jgi:hypothetical protein
VLATWHIRSGNRPVVHDEGGFLAKTREMRVPSTWSILRMRSHLTLFSQRRGSMCALCVSLDQARHLFLLPCASRTRFAVDKKTDWKHKSNQKDRRHVRPKHARGQNWKTFLRNHAAEVWACDFLQVTDLFLRPLFAFFMIELKSRKVIHMHVTRSPTDLWVAQQLREAPPYG